MKKALLTLLSCILLSSFVASRIEAADQEQIKWLANFDEAVNQSKASSKPLLILFTGSDWCEWCVKLEDEVFKSKDFANQAGNKYVFLRLDFPAYAPQDQQLKAQNKQLQNNFNIRSFPTVLLFDPTNSQKIGVTGYRSGGGRPYVDHLQQIIDQYTGYKQKMGSLNNQNFGGSELRQLYAKARELGLKGDAITLISKGINSDESLFFLTERYRVFAKDGQIHHNEAVAIRQQLLENDKNNEHNIHYEVAVIDFEVNCEEIDKENFVAEKAVEPLVQYIEKFGQSDKEHLWRLQMIISQVFLDKDQWQKALKYAESSLESAPSAVQPEIAKAVKNLRSHLN